MISRPSCHVMDDDVIGCDVGCDVRDDVESQKDQDVHQETRDQEAVDHVTHVAGAWGGAIRAWRGASGMI